MESLQKMFENERAEEIAEDATRDELLLEGLIIGVSLSDPKVRFGSAKALRVISERNPEKLYSRIDFFMSLLDDQNTILKWNAMDIIANLTKVDSQNEFKKLYKKFFGLLYEGSLITAAHVVDNSSKIVLSKPELQGEVTEQLLKVEEVPLPTEECRNILIGKTIQALGDYYERIEDQNKVNSFIKRQLGNRRNATKVKAEKFMRKFGLT